MKFQASLGRPAYTIIATTQHTYLNGDNPKLSVLEGLWSVSWSCVEVTWPDYLSVFVHL